MKGRLLEQFAVALAIVFVLAAVAQWLMWPSEHREAAPPPLRIDEAAPSSTDLIRIEHTGTIIVIGTVREPDPNVTTLAAAVATITPDTTVCFEVRPDPTRACRTIREWMGR